MVFSPLLQAMRLHRPIGSVLLFFPCLWSSLMAHQGQCVMYEILILGLGSLWARSLGCLYNDIVDHRFDACVARTQRRPLACGALSVKSAILKLLGFSVTGLLFVRILPFSALGFGMIGVVLALVYPFCKRIMKAPQCVLAITFNMGVFVALALSGRSLDCRFVFLFLIGCAWTIEYDLIYAYQDYTDDKRLCLGSLAVLCGSHGKTLVYALAALRFLLLWSLKPQSLGYTIACLVLFCARGFSYTTLCLQNPACCGRFFALMPLEGLGITMLFWLWTP